MENLKNLLVFISPQKKFGDPYVTEFRLQVDNSLDLGWKPKDILVVTNFSWEYNGVKAIIVPDEHFCAVRPRSIKTAIIPFLIDEKIVEKGKIYWNHDSDAIQNSSITEKELELDNIDCGLTDYGWRPRWCMGSFFFKDNSKDIFVKTRPEIFKDIEDETVMMELTQDPAISERCKRLNVTYNFGMRNVESNYERAIKPIRIVHFHPFSRRLPTLDIFMYGKNGLNMPLMSERLIKIFKYHGIS
ncbi:MAG: hypothetical protein HY044_01275 [Candidatus Woesebacteria bacterium]|nr:MAG: hypothetical protein HY044_01275 [Candidatus Woesebacteria bacterium]